MSNLQLRIVSALVMAAAMLALTWIGGVAFRLLCVLMGAAIFYEWARMERGLHEWRTADGWPAALLAIFLLALAFGLPAWALLVVLLAGVAVAAVVAAVQGAPQWNAGGIAYAGLSALSLAMLRDADASGLVAVLFLFAVVWATDILAYFVGRAVGGPKLAPAISPGKTQSGALGGAAGGVIAGLLLAAAAGLPDLPRFAAIALLLSVVSQAGDLFESWVKRRHGCKDSSALIPGHGGVMDRVDGLVAAALALYLVGWLSGSPDHPARMLFAG